MNNINQIKIVSFIVVDDGNFANLQLTVSSLLYNCYLPFEIIVTNQTPRSAELIKQCLTKLNLFVYCRQVRFCTELFYTIEESIAKAEELVLGDQTVIVQSGKFLPINELKTIFTSKSQRIELKYDKVNRTDLIQKSKLVSIIIPVFNNLQYTKKALAAIFACTMTRYEIIIVDNASSDGTADFLADLRESRPSIFCQAIRVISNPQNLGFAKANNQAANLADGELLLFLNNDTEVQAGWLDSLVDTLANDSQRVIAGSRLLYPDLSIQHAGVAFENGSVQHLFQHFAYNFPSALQERSLQAVTAACMLVRKDFYLNTGGFDEQFINCFEDTDLCLRAVNAGFEVIYQPNSVVIHHESKSKGRKDHEAAAGVLLANRWQDKLVSDGLKILHDSGLAYRQTPDGSILDYALPEDGITGLFYAGIAAFEGQKYNSAWENLAKVYQLIPNESPPDLFNCINRIFADQGLVKDDLGDSHAENRTYRSNFVSIIMPVFNNLVYTQAAVEAVLTVTKTPYELIIVDNNSTDGTGAYLEELKLISLANTACRAIKVISNAQNRNYAAANNQGADVAEGEFLLALNNDTKVTPGWLENMLAAIGESPLTAAVGAKLIYADNSIQHAGVTANMVFNIPFHIMQHADFYHPAVNRRRYFSAVTAACVLIHHQSYNQIGGFNEEFINCFEDVDLCYKLGNLGLKIIYEPRAVIYHFESKTPGRKDNLGHSGKIFRKLWPNNYIREAEDYYAEIGMFCEFSASFNSLSYDFNDISSKERIEKSVNLFEQGQYLEVVDLLYPVYPLTPEKQQQLIYQLLALSLEFSGNLEKASEILLKLIKYYPEPENQQLYSVFESKYGKIKDK